MAVKRWRTIADHGPYAFVPSSNSSSHSPTQPALPATLSRGAQLLLSPALAAIDPSPDFGSFTAGVELMVFVALFTIGAFLVVNWIIKTMRGSE
jgi:hypothetical protein